MNRKPHTPETRARISAALRRPETRHRRDVLTPAQVDEIIESLRGGVRVIDVANDWLITASNVYALLYARGLRIADVRKAA